MKASVKTLVAATMERFGRIDVLVNNAALFLHPCRRRNAPLSTRISVDKVMGGHLAGPFLMVKARLPAPKKKPQ